MTLTFQTLCIVCLPEDYKPCLTGSCKCTLILSYSDGLGMGLCVAETEWNLASCDHVWIVNSMLSYSDGPGMGLCVAETE